MTPSQTPPSPALAPPPGNPRFPLFDGLRGLALLAILDYHVSTYTGVLGTGLGGRFAEAAGPEAVITFFAISGFLLYRPYVAARAAGRAVPSARRYGRRRTLRIVPAYWAALTLLAVYPGISAIFSGQWWRYYGYLQLYSSRTVLSGIPVAWTLCVEVSFYILLPVWALAVRRVASGARGGSILGPELICLGAVALGGSIFEVAALRLPLSAPLTDSLLGQCEWITIGMGFAVLSVIAEHNERVSRWTRRVSDLPELCWLGAAGALAGLVALVPPGGIFGLVAAVNGGTSTATTVGRMVLEAIVITLLLVTVVFEGRRRGLPHRLLGARPLMLLGVIAYGFYLYHLPIVQLLALSRARGVFTASGLDLVAHLHTARTFLLLLATLAVTVVVATLSYRLIELPFLRRKETSRPSLSSGSR